MSIVSNSNLERYVGKQKEWAENRYDLAVGCNYQLTEKAGEVSFYPTGNSLLDCTVNFMFTETPPVSGEKNPDNPSTITGVNSLTVTRGHVRGILENNYIVNLGDTYYGGSVDLATGLITMTWAGEQVTAFTSTSTIYDSTVSFILFSEYYHKGNVSDISSLLFCNRFQSIYSVYDVDCCRFTGDPKYQQQNGVGFFISKSRLDTSGAVDPSSPTKAEYLSAANAWLQNYPVFIAYKLATPQTIQLSPISISALAQQDKYTPRLNTVYSTGTSVQVGYRKSPIREEYEIQQAIASLGGI